MFLNKISKFAPAGMMFKIERASIHIIERKKERKKDLMGRIKCVSVGIMDLWFIICKRCGKDHHVLVIHCHGMEGDCGTETAGRDAVND